MYDNRSAQRDLTFYRQGHTKSYTRTDNLGFTLIEIIFVMFIIAVVSGLAVVYLNKNADKLAHEESKRLYQVVKFARQYSLYTGNVIGIELTPEGYQGALLDPQKVSWNAKKAANLNKAFAFHAFYKGVSVDYEIAESDFVLHKDAQNNRPRNNKKNIIGKEVETLETVNLLFSPIGDSPEFTVDFKGDENTYRLAVSNTGKLNIEDCEEGCR